MSSSSSALIGLREARVRRFMRTPEAPPWKQTLPWILLWPMLNLIARQAPFLAGPARTTVQIKQGAAAGGFTDYHGALYVMLAFQLLFIAMAARQLRSLLRRNLLLIACLALPFISSLWSENAGNSLRMSAKTALCTLFACYLYTRFPTERLMRFLMMLGVISAFVCAATAIVLPSYGVFSEYAGGAWQGICNHKNTLGISMIYLLTPVFFVPGLRRIERASYACLLLFMIGMSQSRGAWLDTVALLTVIAVFYLLQRLPPTESWLAILLVAGFGVAAITAFVSFFDTIAPMLGKDASMSGRSGIYSEVWRAILEKPILGYGFGGFWGTSQNAYQIGIDIGWPNIGYAENGLAEIALQLGFVGVLLVVVLVGRALIQGAKLLSSGESFWRIGWYLSILVLAMATNIDAGWLMTENTLDWVLIIVACVGLNDEWRLRRN